MATTVNNTIENSNVVANVASNNEDGYNANIVNEVVVVDEKKFGKAYFIVGQKYRFGSHYFHFTKFETDNNNHCNWHGILDGKTFVGTSHEWKNACGCDYRRPKNQPNSANDTEDGKANPVVDMDVCAKRAKNAYKAEIAAIETLSKRFGARIVEDVAELCNICVSNTANTMYAAAKEKERKALAAKKETKEYAANVANNKAVIDDIKRALEAEKAKPENERDLMLIMDLTTKLLSML